MSTVLITGANRGLGLEFVRQYARRGWDVLACCRVVSGELQALADKYRSVQLHTLDVADHAAIDTLATGLEGTAIDLLLNNAGFLGRVPFTGGGAEHQAFGNSDFEDWAQVLRVNVFGPMKMAEAFVGHVAASDQKKIVTLSSMLGSHGLNTDGGLYAYRTSKAAVNMVMHSLGIDLKDRGILAVAMHPGWVRTDMGGPNADIGAEEAVAGIIRVIDKLGEQHLGQLLAYDGSVLPY
ncbi:MAG: SDR family oxidoreductase [Gammaproteobacteria bacterium]|jgi:NAD(P)-dependent dehydrogenase (short-subunit alcohol dehydrogenase family)|nr:SDR family oxidoreductase [Gammaproteobacteria bacterium]MDP6616665.1 SDR family oxidoreductase [Gammaproteobacteria bacterium]MDP6694995.1 SDR family oxidoreductase [Gammaproteobacteria bacterium]MDP7042116.1 SDR family oxidoreductase [Gammaproteobacteria bacterium]